MDENEARLRGHEQNISHYKSILMTRLTEVEMRFVERRLAEERFKIAMLEFMSPSHIHSPRPKERVAPDGYSDRNSMSGTVSGSAANAPG